MRYPLDMSGITDTMRLYRRGSYMERREFIRWAGLGLLTLTLTGCSGKASSPNSGLNSGEPVQPAPPTPSPYDSKRLVVAEGTDPATLMDKGLMALGGIGVLVGKGATVVIKPNFSVPRVPEVGATTKPLLVAALVKQCLNAGAKEVKVIDHPFTNGAVCLQTTGIKKEVEAVGGKVYVLDKANESFYRNVVIGGKVLNTALYSRDVLEADVFINFPVLKHHNSTKVTMGLKNLMGLVWDRGIFHSTDLLLGIAELAAFRKPHLTILDATRGITSNGPMGPGAIKEWNQLVLGTDPVAVDAYGASLFGLIPADLGYLTAAARLGAGEIDLNQIMVEKA